MYISFWNSENTVFYILKKKEEESDPYIFKDW